MKEYNLEKLAKEIENLDKPVFDTGAKAQCKARIMNRILADEKMVAAVQEVGRNTVISPYSKAMIRESLLERIQAGLNKPFSWVGFLRFNNKLLSGALVIVLFVGTFVVVNVDDQVVRAAEISYVNSFSGDVELYRNGQLLNLVIGSEIYKGDEIVTGEDGVLEIYFFEHSKARLAPNSHLVITNLDDESSDVAIALNDGRVWSKVVDVDNDEDSKFTVEADDTQIAAKNQAAFDVFLDHDVLSIGVFTQSVDVVKNDKSEKVVNGEKILLSANESELKKLDDNDKNGSWVIENLEIDHKYLTEVEKRLIAAKIDAKGNSFKEDTLLFLTFDDIKKKKLELELAENAFDDAQYRLRFEKDLSADDLADIKEVIGDFKSKVEDFYGLIDEVATTDSLYADDLKVYIAAKIKSHKKDLSVVLPDSPVYEVKTLVNELELKTADDQSDLLNIKVAQAEQKLVEFEEINSKGNKKLADGLYLDYKAGLNDVLEAIKNETPEKAKALKAGYALKLASDLKLLKNMNLPEDKELKDLLADFDVKEPEVVVEAPKEVVVKPVVTKEPEVVVKEEPVIEETPVVEEPKAEEPAKVLPPLL